MTYNPDIHRRRSIRLKGYDYSQNGAYFITICTHDRECLFRDVADGVMELNDAGRVIQKCWDKIPDHFPHVELDEFVVMPNHVHGIAVIIDGRGTACRAPTVERFGKPVSGSIPTATRSFKSAATKCINELRNTPGAQLWQRNYWERVIRDDDELNNIRSYIQNNPLKWMDDSLHPDNNNRANTVGVRHAVPLQNAVSLRHAAPNGMPCPYHEEQK